MANESESQNEKLHIFFFPFMSQGHLIPTVDMAKLFAARGVEATIITTPSNAALFSKKLQRNHGGARIHVRTVDFPTTSVGLPDNFDSLEKITSSKQPNPEHYSKFFHASTMLKAPLEKLLEEFKPDCLVADWFFPWATDVAEKFKIPRLVFHGTSFFSSSATECMRLYEPHKIVGSESGCFTITNLPGEIQMSTTELPVYMFEDQKTPLWMMIIAAKESELKSYGVIVNSFYELEPTYADYYRNVLGRRAWHIGPVSLCNRSEEDKADRGKKASIDGHECLDWLDSKNPNSVIYICFGSLARFTDAQLTEMALGLEASGQDFIWVVSRDKEEDEKWLPDGYEQRIGTKGLIIRGWAPQVLILDHPAVGGFVTHCGWNSTLEAVCGGVPLVAWPLESEQFCNEKLLTRVLGIACSVGVKQWVSLTGEFVGRDRVEKAVREIMVGEKTGERRRRAKELAEVAKRAVVDGGSSYIDLNNLLRDLTSRRREINQSAAHVM